MTLVLRDEVLHLSRSCGCGFVEGYQVLVCPEHKLSPLAFVVRGKVITKPHIRLYMKPFMATVSYPGKEHQKSFAFYQTTAALFDVILESMTQ
jgi:hypothetical protein